MSSKSNQNYVLINQNNLIKNGNELAELFNIKEKSTMVAEEIKTELAKAIEYEKGNLDLKTTTLSTDKIK